MDKDEFFRRARTDLPGPAHDVRVLECTTTWAGPMAGCVLADLGADVVKVELPQGEVTRNLGPFLPRSQLSYVHETVNRNKRCLTLDLRTAEGRDLFLDVAATADVVLENFLPGTLARWGIGYEQVAARKPDVVYVSISGWGQFGPWAGRAGYDPIVQAASGVMALNGNPETGAPQRVPTWLCDDLSGLHAVIAALAALRHRDATGEGQYVDVAMLDAVLFQANGNLTLGAIGEALRPFGAQIPNCVPANAYRCRDGAWVYTGCVLDSHWVRFCALLGRPDLADAPGYRTNLERVANREAVDGLLADWCAGLDRDEVLELLFGSGLAASPVRNFAELVDSEQVRVRDMLPSVELADGVEAPITGPAVKFSRTPTSIRLAAPALGQHTEELLASVGVSRERYEQLRLDGIV